MKRIKYVIVTLIIVITFFLIFEFINCLDSNPHYVVNGILDMDKVDFDNTPVINLDGEWAFYWKQLLEPSAFSDNTNLRHTIIDVPGSWNTDILDNRYPSTGYATYRLRVINIPENFRFGIEKINIRNACKIYINQNLVLEDGKPTKESGSDVVGNAPKLAFFDINEDTADIIVQVSNFEYFTSGIINSIYLGSQTAVVERSFRQNIFEVFAIILMALVGILYLLVHLIILHYKKNETAILFFALSCLLMAFSNGFISQRVLFRFMPIISFETMFKIYYLLLYSYFIMLLFFVNKVNRVFLSDIARNILSTIFGLYFTIVVLTPIKVYSKFAGIYTIIDMIVPLALFLWVLYLYIKERPDKVSFTVHSILLISLYAVNIYVGDNVLYALGMRKNLNVGMLSMMMYSLMLAILLIVIYADAYRKNEELAVKLMENYYALDKKEEVASRNEIAFLQAQIKPHFLFNAMSSVIGLCYSDGERAGNLLQELMNYLKSSFDFDYNSDFIEIQNELDLIKSFVKIEKERFGERIEVIYQIDSAVLKMKIIPLIIEPLVENAIRHGVLKNKQGGRVVLTIEQKSETIEISVEDNGRGISDDKIEMIRNALSNGKGPSLRSGIGLANVNNRLRKFYKSELNIESNELGTKISFAVPATAMLEGDTDAEN